MKGLVLSGGGVKGAYQVGVLDQIRERGDVEYDFVSGISVGAINSLLLAQYPMLSDSVRQLIKLWANISNKDVWTRFKAWPPNVTWLGPFRTFFQDGLYDTYPLLTLLEKNFDRDRILNSGKMLRIGIAEKTTGEYFEVSEKSEDLPKWVLASASFPGAFKSLIGKNGVYSDGGQIHMTPLKSAIEAGCTDIDLILTGPFHSKKISRDEIKDTFKSSLRTIDIMAGAIWKADLKLCQQINKRVENEGDACSYKKVKVTVYAPEDHLLKDFFGSLHFEHDVIMDLIAQGRKAKGLDMEEFLEVAKQARSIPRNL